MNRLHRGLAIIEKNGEYPYISRREAGPAAFNPYRPRNSDKNGLFYYI